MTRFEKWARQQDRAKLICSSQFMCDDCVLKPVCDRDIAGELKGDRWEECEKYLDEEADDEESTKRAD